MFRRYRTVFAVVMLLIADGLGDVLAQTREELFVSKVFTEPGGFTRGIEGPACDIEGNLYAVNYGKLVDGRRASGSFASLLTMLSLYKGRFSIGKVTAEGKSRAFVDLPKGSIGNGIRFNSKGVMLVADWTRHNILKIDMGSKEIGVYAHEPKMNQPNDIAIGANDIIQAPTDRVSGFWHGRYALRRRGESLHHSPRQRHGGQGFSGGRGSTGGGIDGQEAQQYRLWGSGWPHLLRNLTGSRQYRGFPCGPARQELAAVSGEEYWGGV